jgi:hypothetical protein
MKLKRVFGVGLAIAMMAPIGVLSAQAGGAAAATPTCKTQTGTATVKPGLLLTPKKDQTITAITNLAGCTGGGVTKGTGKAVIKVKAGDCGGLAKTGTKMPISETITWSNKKTSTLSGTSTTGPKVAQATISLKVTKGLFLGKKGTTVISFAPKKGQDCSPGHPIQNLTIKGVKPFVLK